MNELEKLKVACSHALEKYSAACADLGTVYDNCYVDSDCWDAYSAARDNSKALWDAYVAADNAFEEAKEEQIK